MFRSYWDEDDIKAVEEVIRRGTYWATGPEIPEFEEEIAGFIGTRYALSFNSGTSALHTALLAHDVKEGEVIVPSFTFIATANAVVLAGGKPVFAEIEDKSYGLDPEDVKERITKKTRAIMPIHYGGAPCIGIKALKEIAADHNLLLIEDAAESLGSRLGKEMVGSFGDSAMFSFCQNKVITTGEGGVMVTDNEEIYQKMRLIQSHGRVENEESDYFSTSGDMDYIQAGFNYRMPTMLAALGLSQLKKIEKNIDMRRKNAGYLSKGLTGIGDVGVPRLPPEYFHVYQMYTIQLRDKEQRNALQKHLTEKGVMTKIYFNPIHLKTLYRKEFGCSEGDLPKTEEISGRVLTLPMYPELTREDMDYILEETRKFMDEDG